MLENDLDMYAPNSTSNWAANIKHCLVSYRFQYAWTHGVANETSFLSAFRRKIAECFQEEWHTETANSDRFSTDRTFKSIHVEEKYLSDITVKQFRDTLIRLLFGINELKVNKRYESENVTKNTAASVQASWKMKVISCCIGHFLQLSDENIS